MRSLLRARHGIIALLMLACTLAAAQTVPSHSPVVVAGKVMDGMATRKVPPIYPPWAKQSRTQGAVILHAIINEKGVVESLEVQSSPHPSLSDAAIEAARQWRYRPYLLNGSPVEVDTTITINFKMGD